MFKLNCVILSLFNTLVSFAEKGQIMMIFVMNNISYIYIIHIFYLSHIYCQRYNSLTLRLVARQVPNCKQVGFVRLGFVFQSLTMIVVMTKNWTKFNAQGSHFIKSETYWLTESGIWKCWYLIEVNRFFLMDFFQVPVQRPSPNCQPQDREVPLDKWKTVRRDLFVCLFVCLRRDFQN